MAPIGYGHAASLSALTLLTGVFVSAPVVQASDWHLRTIARFCSDNNCATAQVNPNGTLTADATGNLFGTVAEGGIYAGGSIFELHQEPGTRKWHLRTIYNFCAMNGCADGYIPMGGVVAATDGNLYGTTYRGGS